MKKDRKEISDADAGIKADRICVSYFLGDPNVSLTDAQNAAIAAQRLAQQLDERHGTGFVRFDIFARDRLQKLGIDPDTLQPLEKTS